jgi:hypothetical protein
VGWSLRSNRPTRTCNHRVAADCAAHMHAQSGPVRRCAGARRTMAGQRRRCWQCGARCLRSRTWPRKPSGATPAVHALHPHSQSRLMKQSRAPGCGGCMRACVRPTLPRCATATVHACDAQRSSGAGSRRMQRLCSGACAVVRWRGVIHASPPCMRRSSACIAPRLATIPLHSACIAPRLATIPLHSACIAPRLATIPLHSACIAPRLATIPLRRRHCTCTVPASRLLHCCSGPPMHAGVVMPQL